MDYEKKYKEALEIARKINSGEGVPTPPDWTICEVIFPELKENEDEKIRKAILNCFIKCWGNCKGEIYGIHAEDAIAWLEKQGESYGQRKECLDCQFNYAGECKGFCPIKEMHKKHASNTKHNWYVSKVDGKIYDLNYVPEPKFKVGDWITNKGHSYLIANIDYEQRRYLFEVGGYTHEQLNWEYIENADNKYHLWTIQDAKDGDVLFHSDSASNGIFIFKEIIDKGFAKEVVCYCDYDSEDHFCLGEHHTCCWTDAKILRPATKEQRELLFKKTHEAGYTFDFDKKELEKIEQKPAWSKEDEKNLLEIKCLIGSYRAGADEYRLDSWIDNFKNRVQPKQEWSKEDEKILDALVTSLNNEVFTGRLKTLKGIGVSSVIDWLKSIKQRIIE